MQESDTPFLWNRTLGLLGVAGALLLFVGDMLFYGHWGSGADFRSGLLATMSQASLTRLYAGGLVGPIAACLGLLGCLQVRQNIVPRSPRLGQVFFLVLAAMMVGIGAVHALWVPRGLALRYAAQAKDSAPDLLAALRDYWNLADLYLAQVPGYLGAVLLLGLVLLGWTRYPRWTAVANPGLLVLCLEPLMPYVPAPLGAGLVGGFSNLALAIFFLVSVASTWNHRWPNNALQRTEAGGGVFSDLHA